MQHTIRRVPLISADRKIQSLTKIIDELNLTVEPEKRAELAEKAANYVHDNVLNSFVLHPGTIVAYNGKKINNWVTTRSEYYMITNKLDVM